MFRVGALYTKDMTSTSRDNHADQLDRSEQSAKTTEPGNYAGVGSSRPHGQGDAAVCLTGGVHCSPTERILEPEVLKHHQRKRKILEFTHSSTRATMLMLGAAILALIIENTPILPNFAAFWQTLELGISWGILLLILPLSM